MTSQQLKNLIQIRDSKSINKASDVLFLTPQALNSSIKSLEKELGVSLVKSDFLGTVLTEQGELLASKAERFLAEVEEVIRETSSISNEENKVVHFASLPGICSAYLEGFYDYLHDRGVNFKVQMDILPFNELLTNIEKGILPYGISYISTLDGQVINCVDNFLSFKLIARLGRTCILVNRDHPLAKYKTVSLKNSLKYPFLLRESTECMFKPIFDIYGHPAEIISVPTSKLFRSALENSQGVLYTYGTSPQEEIDSDKVKCIQVKEKYESMFGLIYRKNKVMTAEEYEGLELLMDYFKGKEIKWNME